MKSTYKSMLYQHGEFVSVDHEGIFFKAYMTIIVNSLNIYIPFVMKSVTEVGYPKRFMNLLIHNIILVSI